MYDLTEQELHHLASTESVLEILDSRCSKPEEKSRNLVGEIAVDPCIKSAPFQLTDHTID